VTAWPAVVGCEWKEDIHMITRHHFAIMITIGVALAGLAIALAMEPGIARGIF
jgi:hypothetical protein